MINTVRRDSDADTIPQLDQPRLLDYAFVVFAPAADTLSRLEVPLHGVQAAELLDNRHRRRDVHLESGSGVCWASAD